ncbi:ubiquitin-like modifier-activating enzyme atg7-like protein [Syncephalis pseudoplumigaleata]|uniref:Ubiquitin-like modifier-activating enzyme ATG7 n=1 Tax=Syncephalis pseudoplumigaleata TaxID=1712513 RepID=A0A4P9Z358_9FUNG|nr:ubiquitin-like modifier-activating enzyme atg7-like protein [Syncephalis pseudoplumigaleata]|eukprot:RKP25930.1 ubiquitin-like modifier-activating enzyme atg7-like protein [Syncephalis pseudoplumigaleata]
MESFQLLQFEPFKSAVDPTFWHQLGKRKLDVYQLDQSERRIRGHYATATRATKSVERAIAAPAQLTVDGEAFEEAASSAARHGRPNTVAVDGTLLNTNTIEEFKTIDKQALLRKAGEQVATAIESGEAWRQPALLCTFITLAFADLKKHKYTYWFGFPALVAPQPAQIRSWSRVDAAWSKAKIAALHVAIDVYSQQQHQGAIPPFFGVVEEGDAVTVIDLQAANAPHQLIIGFVDPSGLENHPGWPLRNLIALLARYFTRTSIRVLCYRDTPGTGEGDTFSALAEIAFTPSANVHEYKVVGWEKNTHGKAAPRVADLGGMMDPRRLADTAIDLNLKLMRWRLATTLQLEKVASTRCLLLGAGTLGSYVARCLLGWGVRHITFVDSATVSFSNPVRQPLFNYEDCLEGGRPKAPCAAANLAKVYPGVNATGHTLRIPMPGHPVTDDQQTQADIKTLIDLIAGHDAVFLLMDSRESRWLPTLLGAHHGKIVINAALGFDTFLVMRHGVPGSQADAPIGCYYCNDVVAPTDSLRDRSLDQQCTVTRPGLAAIASAMAVELLVSILHHPQGANAPPETDDTPEAHDKERPLGVIPHQIRGHLASYRNLLVHGPAYDRCTACSSKVWLYWTALRMPA